jgi:TonB family protein
MIFRALRFAVLLCVLPAAAIAQDAQKPYFVCGPQQPSEKGPCATAPRAKSTPDPEYSKEARKQRIQGTVILLLTVGADGIPQDIKVTRGLGYGLNEQAVSAVKSWRFEPSTVDGKPVPVQINVEVNFRLYGGPQQPAPAPGPVTLQDAAKLYSQAVTAESAEDCGTAISLLGRVTDVQPQHWGAWNLLGLCYLQEDDYTAAENAFKKQIEVSPQSPYAYNNLGRVYLHRGDFDKALVEFRKQLEINP